MGQTMCNISTYILTTSTLKLWNLVMQIFTRIDTYIKLLGKKDHDKIRFFSVYSKYFKVLKENT